MVRGLLVVLLAAPCWSTRGPHHPHSHPRPISGGPKITSDSALLHDKEHIQEEIGSGINIEDINKMTPEELEFHYFKIHDYDNNNKLDGLEILHAIRHTVEHRASEKGPPLSKEDLAHFVDLIDQVLEEDDQDRDGYICYTEYVNARQRDSSKRENRKNIHYKDS